MGRAKRIWYLSPMRAAKVQASLRIRAVSPEPPLLAHTSSESSGTFRQKARSLAHLNSWACAVEIRHDGMLEDTNSLGAAQILDLTLTNYLNQLAKPTFRFRYAHTPLGHGTEWRIHSTNEPRHDKFNKMSVRPAKTRISLGIRPVWSVHSIGS